MRRLAHDLPRLILGMAFALAMNGCSGDTGWRCISNADDSGRCWISPDDMRSLLVDRTSNNAHYFDNTPGRLCFTYAVTGIAGEWLPVPGYDGLFSVGPTGRIGVTVYHRDDLPGSVDAPVLKRAVALLEQLYREAFGPVSVTVTPFRPVRFTAIRFDATWKMTVEGGSALVRATKILMEYSPEWVIQISVDGTVNDSGILDQIVNSFRTTDASNRFWPEINRMLADIGGFSDGPARARSR